MGSDLSPARVCYIFEHKKFEHRVDDRNNQSFKKDSQLNIAEPELFDPAVSYVLRACSRPQPEEKAHAYGDDHDYGIIGSGGKQKYRVCGKKQHKQK